MTFYRSKSHPNKYQTAESIEVNGAIAKVCLNEAGWTVPKQCTMLTCFSFVLFWVWVFFGHTKNISRDCITNIHSNMNPQTALKNQKLLFAFDEIWEFMGQKKKKNVHTMFWNTPSTCPKLNKSQDQVRCKVCAPCHLWRYWHNYINPQTTLKNQKLLFTFDKIWESIWEKKMFTQCSDILLQLVPNSTDHKIKWDAKYVLHAICGNIDWT